MKTLLLTAIISVALTFSQIPPTQPPQYSVHFQEVLTAYGKTYMNNGSWFYDFPHGQMRYDHLRGQRDNFCYGQNLSDSDPHGPCSLLFSQQGEMYVIYPEMKTCCALCGKKESCTPLKPTWLSNATLHDKKMIQGHLCYGWLVPGFAFNDELYVTEDNIPCQYTETSYKGNISHTITFDQKSYTVGQPDQSLFEVPMYCKSKCPNPFT